MVPVLLQFEPFTPATLFGWDVLVGVLALLAIWVGLRAREDLADAMGLTHADIALLTVGSLAGQILNVPLAIVDGAVLAVNLGGVLVPAILVVRWGQRRTVGFTGVVLGTAVVAVVTSLIVDVRPGQGVVAPFPAFLLPAVAALVLGFVASKGRLGGAGPHAFAMGSFGALIGADVLLLPNLDRLTSATPEGAALVIGGAGAFDLVFLSGSAALAMIVLVGSAVTRPPAGRVMTLARPVRIPDPQGTLVRAERLGALSPRELCLSHLATASIALIGRDGAGATLEAHRGVDALLRSGTPRLIERLQTGGASPELEDELKQLAELARRAHHGTPGWTDAAEAVELAKRTAGGLWDHATGSVRIEGAGP